MEIVSILKEKRKAFFVTFSVVVLSVLSFFLFPFFSKQMSKPTMKLSSIANGVKVEFFVDTKTQEKLASFFQNLGMQEEGFLRGFEAQLDASTTAKLRPSLPKEYEVEISENEFIFHSEKKNRFPFFSKEKEIFLWETTFLPSDTQFFLKGVTGEDLISLHQDWNDQQRKWMNEIADNIDVGGVLAGVVEDGVLQFVFLSRVSKTEAIKETLALLKDVEFDSQRGVLGYSEKTVQGVEVFQSFITTFTYNNFFVLSSSPVLSERILQLMSVKSQEEALASDALFLTAREKIPQNEKFFYLRSPGVLFDTENEIFSLTSLQETSPLFEIFDKIRFITVSYSEKSVYGKIVLQ